MFNFDFFLLRKIQNNLETHIGNAVLSTSSLMSQFLKSSNKFWKITIYKIDNSSLQNNLEFSKKEKKNNLELPRI